MKKTIWQKAQSFFCKWMRAKIIPYMFKDIPNGAAVIGAPRRFFRNGEEK